MVVGRIYRAAASTGFSYTKMYGRFAWQKKAKWFKFSRQRRIWSFHVVALQKSTKIYDARAQPLFCSLNLLFRDAPVAFAVVAFLNSLIRGDRKAGFHCKKEYHNV